jgi:phage terminase large subunit
VKTRTNEFYVAEEFYERRCTDNDLAEVATEIQGRWGPGTFYCDPSEPDSIETFRRADIDAVGAENDITPGIKTVTNAMPNLYVRESCANLIGEMKQYHYPEDEEGDDVVPVKKNDHAPDALRYALHSFVQQGGHSLGVATGDLYK